LSNSMRPRSRASRLWAIVPPKSSQVIDTQRTAYRGYRSGSSHDVCI
jgi:hypothetical protein